MVIKAIGLLSAIRIIRVSSYFCDRVVKVVEAIIVVRDFGVILFLSE